MVPTTQSANATQGMLDPNLAYLDAELRLLSLQLEELTPADDARKKHIPSNEVQDEKAQLESFLQGVRDAASEQRWRPRSVRVAEAFLLNEFERKLLLLAASADLDETFCARIARAQGSRTAWPCVGLAWRMFCGSLTDCLDSRDSLREDSPLFRFRLLEKIGTDSPLPEQMVRADRRIVDFLAGRAMPDGRIARYVRQFAPSQAEEPLRSCAPELAVRLAARIRALLGDGAAPRPQLVVNLCGPADSELELFAADTCRCAGLPLLAANAGDISADNLPLFARESILLSSCMYLGGVDPKNFNEGERRWNFADCAPIVFLGSEAALRSGTQTEGGIWLPVEVPRPDVEMRENTWRSSLTELGIEPNGHLDTLADNFEFGTSEIHRAVREAANLAWLDGQPLQSRHLAAACKHEAHRQMNELAQQLKSPVAWEELLLPDTAIAKLRELCAQVRCQHIVMGRYGFAGRLTRGRGITALFAGASGTGKTMAAEVIAGEIQRDLYRVDLARVVSKYVGETEKNLRQIFAEAECARCVLLFDEADALFGRRTEVRDSHDRYANIEVSYLLQLMEETEFSVILLATNRRDAIDEAFLRRFRFVVDFPLPAADMRRKLWEKSFPPQVKLSGVRFDVLADRLPLSAASIKNIALAASYLAANNGGIVGAKEIAHATKRELERMGRPAPFSDADLSGQPVAHEAAK
jgi:ATPase family associated with various cellular activities (AAA)